MDIKELLKSLDGLTLSFSRLKKELSRIRGENIKILIDLSANDLFECALQSGWINDAGNGLLFIKNPL